MAIIVRDLEVDEPLDLLRGALPSEHDDHTVFRVDSKERDIALGRLQLVVAAAYGFEPPTGAPLNEP
ncbi:MAG: hypothetical protein ITG02_06415 [Patulibacter sp.]|nr:hypothetical protein [Patulibacter sp.]